MKIDYEAEVVKVYPDAEVLDNETETHYPNLYWITDGHGNDISDDCHWGTDNPWKSAYNKLIQQGKIIPCASVAPEK